ncbi:hypothetical protein [Pengzhenrongella phosphoraccumulans]|uniref:hypothetical protein n=1 Tax=Pengzhenrongella phosphoraccumulans TaxID=3114394 RepID=UPI00388CFB72
MTKLHILRAIAECDDRGADVFLEVYGFELARDYPLVHEGRSYDSRAILGVAHRFATGRLATSDAFGSDMSAAVAILRKRGFEVTEPASAYPATPLRSARAPRTPAARTPAVRSTTVRSTAAREAPSAICPTCSMTLPATGICDDCG